MSTKLDPKYDQIPDELMIDRDEVSLEEAKSVLAQHGIDERYLE